MQMPALLAEWIAEWARVECTDAFAIFYECWPCYYLFLGHTSGKGFFIGGGSIQDRYSLVRGVCTSMKSSVRQLTYG